MTNKTGRGVTLYLRHEEYELLTQAASLRGMAPSTLVREWIRRSLPWSIQRAKARKMIMERESRD